MFIETKISVFEVFFPMYLSTLSFTRCDEDSSINLVTAVSQDRSFILFYDGPYLTSCDLFDSLRRHMICRELNIF
jgi:hypothetical protein